MVQSVYSKEELEDLVRGIGHGYHLQSNNSKDTQVLEAGYLAADTIPPSRRSEAARLVIDCLKELADSSDSSDTEFVAGSCLLLGHWQIQEALATISRFLKSDYAIVGPAAAEALRWLTATGNGKE